MKLSFLQLNINADNYWDILIPYLKSHDFDVMHFQEVTGKGTVIGNVQSKRDTFKALQKALEDKYNGELSIGQRFSSDPDSYMANSIFYKKSFPLIEKKDITISQFDTFFPSDSKEFQKVGRTLLHLIFNIDGKQISFLNNHFAWGGNSIEKPFQTEQGEVLLNYLKTVQAPFVFSGDLNINPEQPLIKKLDKLARNLTTEHHVTNTLDPKNHSAKQLFPKGLAVDYIFTSHDLSVKSFSVIDEGLSDHLGLTAEIEI